MRKSPTDAGFRMFAGFIASRRFDQLRPISTIFDRQLTPLLTPALGASGSSRRWLAGADAVSAGLATSSRHERETAAERRTPSRIGHRPSRAAVDASTRRGAPVRPSAHADRTRQVGALARGTYVKGQEPARGKPWPAGPCVRGPAVTLIRRKAAGQTESSMSNSKRFEHGFPPLAKEGQGGFEHASRNPPQSPFFKGGSCSRGAQVFSDWG